LNIILHVDGCSYKVRFPDGLSNGGEVICVSIANNHIYGVLKDPQLGGTPGYPKCKNRRRDENRDPIVYIPGLVQPKVCKVSMSVIL